MPKGIKKGYLDFQLEQASPEELKAIAEKVDNRLFDTTVVDTSKTELVSVGELAEDARELVKNWGKMVGLSTGIRGVDYNSRGLAKGELIVIAGETGNGKTALGVNIATNVARAGHPVLFVTLEITHAALAARVSKLLPNEADLLTLPLFMQREDQLDWKDIDALIDNAIENKAELVVIDHLHFFSREINNLAEDLGRITKQFKTNARRHNIPIILISHVRKKEGSKAPELANEALRGSSYIAQDADVVMFVHKVSADQVIVKTTKNRRGYDYDNDTVHLAFIEGAKITDLSGTPSWVDPFKDLK